MPEGDGVRLVIKLQVPLPVHPRGGGASNAGVALVDVGEAFSRAAHLPAERLRAVEASTTGSFVILDLLLEGKGGATLAQTLHMVSGSAEALADMGRLRIDRLYGIYRQLEDDEGEAVQLLPPPDTRVSSTEHRAMVITLCLIGAAMVSACCCPLLRTLCGSCRGSRTHSRISMEKDSEADLAAELDGPQLPPSPSLSYATKQHTPLLEPLTFD